MWQDELGEAVGAEWRTSDNQMHACIDTAGGWVKAVVAQAGHHSTRAARQERRGWNVRMMRSRGKECRVGGFELKPEGWP
eukprot:COSAG06_NODE_19498_length_835_cov_1.195652_1_plen_79_part_10